MTITKLECIRNRIHCGSINEWGKTVNFVDIRRIENGKDGT